MKRQATERDKIFVNNISTKRLMSKNAQRIHTTQHQKIFFFFKFYFIFKLYITVLDLPNIN